MNNDLDGGGCDDQGDGDGLGTLLVMMMMDQERGYLWCLSVQQVSGLRSLAAWPTSSGR